MTVRVNTITRDKRHRDLGWYCAKGVPIPRSIVTDHRILKAQGRPNLASSISLYVSDHG